MTLGLGGMPAVSQVSKIDTPSEMHCSLHRLSVVLSVSIATSLASWNLSYLGRMSSAMSWKFLHCSKAMYSGSGVTLPPNFPLIYSIDQKTCHGRF